MGSGGKSIEYDWTLRTQLGTAVRQIITTGSNVLYASLASDTDRRYDAASSVDNGVTWKWKPSGTGTLSTSTNSTDNVSYSGATFFSRRLDFHDKNSFFYYVPNTGKIHTFFSDRGAFSDPYIDRPSVISAPSSLVFNFKLSNYTSIFVVTEALIRRLSANRAGRNLVFPLGAASNGLRFVTPVIFYKNSTPYFSGYTILYSDDGVVFKESNFPTITYNSFIDASAPCYTKLCWSGTHFIVVRAFLSIKGTVDFIVHKSQNGIDWTEIPYSQIPLYGTTTTGIPSCLAAFNDKVIMCFNEHVNFRTNSSKLFYSLDGFNSFLTFDLPSYISMPEIDPNSEGFFSANACIWDDKYSKFTLVGCIHFATKKVAAITKFDGKKFDKPSVIADSKSSPITKLFLYDAHTIAYDADKYYVGGADGIFTSFR